jgi:hypothetical protein
MVEFRRHLELQWWKVIIDQVQLSFNEGVYMHVLGYKNPMKVFLCVPFMVGDDPQQNKLAGVFEAGNHSCRICNFPTKSTLTYDKLTHKERDITLIEPLALDFDAIKKGNANTYIGTGRNLKNNQFVNPDLFKKLQSLTDESIHYSPYNPFFQLPMGRLTTNILFGGTPADDFHTFCAGLLASVLSWVLRIVMFMDNSFDEVYMRKSKERLEKRVKAMPSGCESSIPHVPFTRFRTGLTYIVTGEL